jgi:hypothetical protein
MYLQGEVPLMFRAVLALAVSIAAAAPALAGAQLVLRDGTTIEGVSVERRGELFLLKLEGGSIATIPADNVKELRLQDDPDAAPNGVKLATPKALAGPSTEPVTTGGPAELLAAFPKPVTAPRPPPLRTEWKPTDALAGRDVSQFRPARWYRAPIDPTWTPTPAFTNRSDVSNFRPARWTKVIESVWVPKDGFADAVSNPRRKVAEAEAPAPAPGK